MFVKRDNYNAYMADYMLRRYHRRRAWAIEFLGGRCRKCGATDQEKHLQFDHIVRATKSFTLAAKMVSCSEEKFKREVRKCQLHCDDCHQERHAEDYRAEGKKRWADPAYRRKTLRGMRAARVRRIAAIAPPF